MYVICYMHVTCMLHACRDKEGRAYGNIGSCYELLRDYPEAIFYHKKVSTSTYNTTATLMCDTNAEIGGSAGNRGHAL